MIIQSQQQLLGGAGSSPELTQIMIKGKRTKRPRPLSPLRLTMTPSSSCGGESFYEGNNNNLSSSSSSIESVGGEEEDMANCLILLAQGQYQNRKLSEPVAAKQTTTVTAKSIRSGYVYQCKTCNRCFPSFQALGGHRASHKKPNNKGCNVEEKKGTTLLEKEETQMLDNNDQMNTTLSLQIAANRGSSSSSHSSSTNNNVIKSSKVHECSICGAEFSSGQALGGHMRRHRAAFVTPSITPAATPPPSSPTVSLVGRNPEYQEGKKARRNSNLQLDLNLPAPEDNDHRESKFHFASKEQLLVFSASPMVDCHY